VRSPSHFRMVDFGIHGRVIFEQRRDDATFTDTARELSDVLRDLGGIANYGFVKRSLAPSVGVSGLHFAPPRPPHVDPQYAQVAWAFDATHVPDAFGIQLLTAA